MCDTGKHGSPWDEFARAAEEFGKSMEGMFQGFGCQGPDAGAGPFGDAGFGGRFRPRMNRFISRDGTLVFEFLMPGFELADIDLGFAADTMYLSAKRPVRAEEEASEGSAEAIRGFRIKDIERREYAVSASRWDQAGVKAVFRSGILRVSIPPKAAATEEGGVKVEVKEG